MKTDRRSSRARRGAKRRAKFAMAENGRKRTICFEVNSEGKPTCDGCVDGAEALRAYDQLSSPQGAAAE